MYVRIHRRIPLVPGFAYLNVGKRGLSLSVGRRGFWLTFGRGGVRVTAGLPGSGVSATEKFPYPGNRKPNG